MGVYHLMGLGLSPGAVTGPISYLAELYNNWETEGKEFFASSGEAEQRDEGQKVGAIQSLIIFTTKEIIEGEKQCDHYTKNPYGKVSGNREKPDKMKKVLKPLLQEEWSKIKGQENPGIIYWCEVDRRDIQTTYKRVAKVVASLAKGSGGQGKELWMNLTGGNNVINFALQMAASLSGEVARLYYVQAVNDKAEECVRFTNRNSYWVELPVMPLVMSDLSNAILDVLSLSQPILSKELHNKLVSHQTYWSLMQGIDYETFRNKYLRPMKKQGLITVNQHEVGNGMCTLGPQWELIFEYDAIMKEALNKAEEQRLTIEKLAEQPQSWITKQEIQLN